MKHRSIFEPFGLDQELLDCSKKELVVWGCSPKRKALTKPFLV